MSKLETLKLLIEAIKKSKNLGYSKFTDLEVLMHIISLLQYVNTDTGFKKRGRLLMNLSANMTEADLLKIAKAEVKHQYVKPVDVLGILHSRYNRKIPPALLIEIIGSGAKLESAYATNIAISLAIEPLLPIVEQLITDDDYFFTENPEYLIDCGAVKVSLVCEHSCPMLGRCLLFKTARAILLSPIFGKYMGKDTWMSIDSVFKAATEAIRFCGVPERNNLSIDKHTKLGKLLRIAKGKKSKANASDAVYSIIDRFEKKPQEVIHALLKIVECGTDEPATMIATNFIQTASEETDPSAIEDITVLLNPMPYGADMEVAGFIVISGGVDLEGFDIGSILKQLVVDGVLQRPSK